MAAPRVSISSNWQSTPIPLRAARRGRRRGPAADELISAELLEPAGLQIAYARELTQKKDGAELVPETIDLAADAGPDEHYVLAIKSEKQFLDAFKTPLTSPESIPTGMKVSVTTDQSLSSVVVLTTTKHAIFCRKPYLATL